MTKPNVVIRVVAVLFVLAFLTLPAVAQQQPPQPPQPPPGFVSVDELPPQEQIPAAPLLIGAYAFVVAALFAYVVSVARRVGAVQRDIARLEADFRKNSRT